MNKIICRTLLLVAALFCASEIAAQGLPSLFGRNGRKNNTQRSNDIPTVVTATTMDIDLNKNVATLLGDVFVDDQDMTIRCNKMLIFFEDQEEESAADAKKQGKDAKKDTKKQDKTKSKIDDSTDAGKKKPVRIECFEDVVIQAKQKSDDKEQKEQKATAGKAIYDLKRDEITLTEKPVLLDGTNKVVGSKIVFIVKDERMIVHQGVASTQEGLSELGGRTDK